MNEPVTRQAVCPSDAVLVSVIWATGDSAGSIKWLGGIAAFATPFTWRLAAARCSRVQAPREVQAEV
jgi:hypothetical protein